MLNAPGSARHCTEVSAVGSVDADSINLVDWMLENVSKAAMGEIKQAALAAIIDEGVAQEEADEIERFEERMEATA